MDVGHRGAFIDQHEDMRDMRKIGPRSPPDRVERLINDNTLRHIQHNTILCESARQSGELSFLSIDRFSDHPFQKLGIFLFSSPQVGEDNTLLDKLFIQFDFHMIGSKNDLPAMLIGNQGIEQIFSNARKAGCIVDRQLELIRRQCMDIGAAPGFLGCIGEAMPFERPRKPGIGKQRQPRLPRGYRTQ